MYISYKKESTNNPSKYHIDTNVIYANYSEKGNMKKYFVTYVRSLKLVSAIFIFSPNVSFSRTIKNVFYFI